MPEAKLKEAKEQLRKLITFCCSGRRYEQKNPYLIPEIREAVRWLYGEEFPPNKEVE